MNTGITSTLIEEFNFDAMPTLLLMVELNSDWLGSIDLLVEAAIDIEMVTLTTILEFPIIKTESKLELTVDLLATARLKDRKARFKSPIDIGIWTKGKILIGDERFNFILLRFEATAFINEKKRFALGDRILEFTAAAEVVTTEADTFVEDDPTEEIPVKDDINREVSNGTDEN